MTIAVINTITRTVVPHVECPNELRVRIDVYDDIENYAVAEGRMTRNSFHPTRIRHDYRIDLT